MVTAPTLAHHHMRSKRRPAERSALLSTVVFAGITVYLGSIVLKESVEGHVSTSRSWFATVVIGSLGLLAAWRAVRSWRRLAEARRLSRDQRD
jgi:hypothetical protein